MVYTKTITEAAGGSISNPSLYRMPVTAGLIYRFELYFPPGSSGLLKVAMKDGDSAMYPSEPGEWFFGDNHVIQFDDLYWISSDPYSLAIWCYNEDEAFEHVFQIRIGQVSDQRLIANYIPGATLANIGDEIQKIADAQDQSYEARRERLLAQLEELGE